MTYDDSFNPSTPELLKCKSSILTLGRTDTTLDYLMRVRECFAENFLVSRIGERDLDSLGQHSPLGKHHPKIKLTLCQNEASRRRNTVLEKHN